ncbi:MAG TPA: hypothetical protein VJQ06_13720 [Rhizomicrobium sp.]|nr:hypothetical protein [Rhizomicrobium sp.]
MQGWDARPKARQIVCRAIKSSWQIVRAMPLLFVGVTIAYVLVSIATVEISNLLPASMADQAVRSSETPSLLTYADFLPLQILLLVKLFFQAVILAPIEIAIYRFILLRRTSLESPSILMPYVRRYVAWTFVFDLVMHVSGQAEFLPAPWGVFYGLPLLFFSIVYIWLYLILPAIAVGAPSTGWQDRVRTAIRQTRRNFWMLMCTFGILLIPVCATMAVLFLSTSETESDKALLSWPYQTGVAVLTIAFGAIGAAAVSWIYAWVTNAEPREV